MNINDLSKPELIRNLYDKYYIADGTPENVVSSHWKKFGSKIDMHIDRNGNLASFKGYGFGDLNRTNILNRALKYFCNFTYFVKFPDKKDLIFLIKKAIPNLRKINSYLSYDCFRQMCSLCKIREYLNIREEESFNILVIGDGYGFLSSLLKSLYPTSKITLIDIGKVLLFQVINLQIIHSHYRHVSVDEANLNKKDFYFLYVPAESIDKIMNMKYKFSINIASMQEMNYATIKRYFEFLRTHSTKDNLFYCCNRKIKKLLGGEIIEFLKYPWLDGDRHLVDEICPFYKYTFSARFPFIHKFEGLFFQRLTNLKIDGHLY